VLPTQTHCHWLPLMLRLLPNAAALTPALICACVASLHRPSPAPKQSQFIVVSLKEGMFNNANVIFRTKFVDGVSTVTRTVNDAAGPASRGRENALGAAAAAGKAGSRAAAGRGALRESNRG